MKKTGHIMMAVEASLLQPGKISPMEVGIMSETLMSPEEGAIEKTRKVDMEIVIWKVDMEMKELEVKGVIEIATGDLTEVVIVKEAMTVIGMAMNANAIVIAIGREDVGIGLDHGQGKGLGIVQGLALMTEGPQSGKLGLTWLLQLQQFLVLCYQAN